MLLKPQAANESTSRWVKWFSLHFSKKVSVFVSARETSRLEVAKFILNFYNLEDKVIINEVSSDYFSSTYHAPRPYCERLINYKLNLINMNIMRDWEICLKEYLINSFNEIN